jgi:hypothetical protein
MIIEFQWSLLTENNEQRWQKRKKYFLTSEQSEGFVSLSIDGAKYVVLKVFSICF